MTDREGPAIVYLPNGDQFEGQVVLGEGGVVTLDGHVRSITGPDTGQTVRIGRPVSRTWPVNRVAQIAWQAGR